TDADAHPLHGPPRSPDLARRDRGRLHRPRRHRVAARRAAAVHRIDPRRERRPAAAATAGEPSGRRPGLVTLAAVKVFQAERHFQTTGGLHVTDITDDVAEIVRESGIQDGICLVYSPHTTCCVRVNEYEGGMFEDFGTLLRRLIPHETYYAHDDW